MEAYRTQRSIESRLLDTRIIGYLAVAAGKTGPNPDHPLSSLEELNPLSIRSQMDGSALDKEEGLSYGRLQAQQDTPWYCLCRYGLNPRRSMQRPGPRTPSWRVVCAALSGTPNLLRENHEGWTVYPPKSCFIHCFQWSLWLFCTFFLEEPFVLVLHKVSKQVKVNKQVKQNYFGPPILQLGTIDRIFGWTYLELLQVERYASALSNASKSAGLLKRIRIIQPSPYGSWLTKPGASSNFSLTETISPSNGEYIADRLHRFYLTE